MDAVHVRLRLTAAHNVLFADVTWAGEAGSRTRSRPLRSGTLTPQPIHYIHPEDISSEGGIYKRSEPLFAIGWSYCEPLFAIGGSVSRAADLIIIYFQC